MCGRERENVRVCVCVVVNNLTHYRRNGTHHMKDNDSMNELFSTSVVTQCRPTFFIVKHKHAAKKEKRKSRFGT